MMKRLLPLLLLIIAIFVSGCAGISQLQGGRKETLSCPGAGVTDGIAITDFSFDFNQIYGSEQVGLTLTAENVGGSTGALTSYQLFGMDFGSGSLQWGITPSSSNSNVNLKLDAPNTDLGIPGGMDTRTWTLKAPSGLTVETPFTLHGRITSNYSTSFSGILTVVSSSYLRSLPVEERKALIQSGGLSAQCYTGGPIKIEAAAGTHFVDPSGTKNIRFKVTNVGVGAPFYNTSAPNYLGITPESMYKIYVVPTTSGQVTCTGGDITLSRGQTGSFTCTFTSPTPTLKTDYPFQISIVYQYWQDTTASIKVLRPL